MLIKRCDVPRAIEINPQRSEAWNDKGSALGNLGIQAWDKAIDIDPQNAMAYTGPL